MKHLGLVMIALVLAGASFAAIPPTLFNYQGVLRDADGVPIEGDRDMVFRFWSADLGGDEILVDGHTAAGTGAVTVTGGLFNVHLGGGAVSDGSGPGFYLGLARVFADHAEVWLEIEVRGETLSPRIRVLAEPYAANAAYLQGVASSTFLDTTSGTQSKLGKLVIGAAAGGALYGLEGHGADGGAYFKDADGSGYARLGVGETGVLGYGDEAGGLFETTDGHAYAYLGVGDQGVRGFGAARGGRFEHLSGSSYGNLGAGDQGVTGSGDAQGGYFEDRDSTGYARVGVVGYGILAYGNEYGGHFEDTQSGDFARLGTGDRGIEASASGRGGSFHDLDDSGHAYLGAVEGVDAYGSEAAGIFANTQHGSWTRFADLSQGIDASGSTAGGYFSYLTGSSGAYLGYGSRGIAAFSDGEAGHFRDLDTSGEASVGHSGGEGITAWGDAAAGHFEDANGDGHAYVGYGDRGIWAKGGFAGGTLSHPDDVTYWADVARVRDSTTYKIRGTGAVAFVQNHPRERDRLVVYAAPEGDEVAVYTRGSARLTHGEARVKLGETFALVVHPDVGLTAHLTSRAEATPLSVAALTHDELRVRGPAGSNAAFDYLVYGLRIGFEEHSPLQLKDREAFLPPREAAAEFYASHPELRPLNALERFMGMRAAGAGNGEPDLSRSEALIAAIEEDREQIVGASRMPIQSLVTSPTTTAHDEDTWLPVAASVETGDVLALDTGLPGHLRKAVSPADPTVIGVASGPVRETTDGGLEVPIAVFGIVELRADAGYGEIRPGDLLVASPTPGHAMRALDVVPGTILGKAIAPLPLGTGTIRALLVMR